LSYAERERLLLRKGGDEIVFKEAGLSATADLYRSLVEPSEELNERGELLRSLDKEPIERVRARWLHIKSRYSYDCRDETLW